MQTAARNNFFQQKHTTSVSFLVALLLFFLPFVQIRCNDQPYAENTGMGLAFGANYKVTAGLQELNGSEEPGQKKEIKGEKGKMYVLALIALLAGVSGLLVSLSDHRFRAVTAMAAGAVAAISLVIVMFQIRGDVRSTPPNLQGDSADTIRITAHYTLWFYLSVCSFIAATFFGYRHFTETVKHNTGSDTGDEEKPREEDIPQQVLR